MSGPEVSGGSRGGQGAPTSLVSPGSLATSPRGLPVVQPFRVVRQLLSVREVAQLLSVSRATVYSLIERGELERVWVVTALRVPAESVDAYIAHGRSRR